MASWEIGITKIYVFSDIYEEKMGFISITTL